MKLLKWLAGIVVALGLVVVLGGLLISPKFSVVRSALIPSPPDKVYALVASPRTWKDWSVWTKRDPLMQITYFGPESGSGAGWQWKSKSEGDGRMTFTSAEAGKRIGYELSFPDFGTSTGAFDFAPEGGGTRVTWRLDGDFGANPVFRWFTLLADRMTGQDFEGGLANLKALAEKG
jgi:uncharacterized protein YndB with AHSA1/START domain